MNKVPYPILDAEVEKTFQSGLVNKNAGDTATVVEALVVCSGWTLDEYLERFCYEDES